MSLKQIQNIFPLLVLFSIINPLFASVITVGAGKDYQTIQSAIDASINGDEIIVSPGTYIENIQFKGKNIILRSEDPDSSSTVESTIIDGNKAGSVVTFDGTEETSCVLSGFTITNGLSVVSGGNGGGIRGGSSTSIRSKVTISKNIIKNNDSSKNGFNGGGIAFCDGLIYKNTISNNSGYSGGGAAAYSDGNFVSNNIYGNRAANGGAFYQCNGVISNCLIYNNKSGWYGSAFMYCQGMILNCTIYNNKSNGYPTYNYVIEDCYNSFIANCIIWDDTATYIDFSESNTPTLSCVKGWSRSGSNFPDDPNFVDPANGDFKLKKSSSCINRGNPYYLFGFNQTLDGYSRIHKDFVDVGCYEYGSSKIDTDGDLLSDDEEIIYGTNPLISDTDKDGVSDWGEIQRGTSPLIPNSAQGISVSPKDFAIQKAVFTAFEGETITINPGTYHENIYCPGENLILTSINPTSETIVLNTIIHGKDEQSVIRFKGNENESSGVYGLTLTNGASEIGGGIDGNGSLVTIKYNIIKNCLYPITHNYFNSAISDCDGLIQDNIITDNYQGITDCDGTIKNNIIAKSIQYYSGYGGCGISNSNAWILCNLITKNKGYGLSNCNDCIECNIIEKNSTGIYEGEAVIRNNIIAFNSGYEAGGIFNAKHFIDNNTIYYNTAKFGGGGLSYCTDYTSQNNVIWGNISLEYSSYNQIYQSTMPYYTCIQDWTGEGTMYITTNPLFIKPEKGDFRFYRKSPCIDFNGMSYDCQPAGLGKRTGDIGAFGAYSCRWNIKPDSYWVKYYLLKHYSPNSEFIKEMDVNKDGKTDIGDLVTILNTEDKTLRYPGIRIFSSDDIFPNLVKEYLR